MKSLGAGDENRTRVLSLGSRRRFLRPNGEALINDHNA